MKMKIDLIPLMKKRKSVIEYVQLEINKGDQSFNSGNIDMSLIYYRCALAFLLDINYKDNKISKLYCTLEEKFRLIAGNREKLQHSILGRNLVGDIQDARVGVKSYLKK